MPRLSSFVFTSVVLLACGSAPGVHPALLVLPGAVDLASAPANEIGEEKIEYRLSTPFPARAATQAISEHLADLGYMPRTENLLNPGLPLLSGDSWSPFGDMTTEPGSCVRQWWREWQDLEGTVVTYILAYRWPAG